MARGRMLSKKISLNKALAELPDDTSRLLFTWTLAHLDCAGRIHGDPDVLRSIVAPRLSHVTAEVVARCVGEWVAADLVVWYQANGDKYLAFPKFQENQTGLRTDREAPSDIPEPTPDLLRSNAGEDRGKLREVKLREGKASRVAKEPKEPKKEYAKGVAFTDSEYANMCAKHGKVVVDAAAEILSAYKEAHGKEYKSDAGALREWALGEAVKRGAKKQAWPPVVVLQKCPNGHDYLPGQTCRTCGWKEGENAV